jgi:hypothetical protein
MFVKKEVANWLGIFFHLGIAKQLLQKPAIKQQVVAGNAI